MASPRQKRVRCGNLMAGSDNHSYCARCRKKERVQTLMWSIPSTVTVSFGIFLLLINVLSPSYKLKKEKRKAKKTDITATPSKEHVDTVNPSLVDPASVLVIGALDGQGILHWLQSPRLSGPA